MEERMIKEGQVHKILAHSYSLYLGALLLSLLLDFVFPQKFFSDSLMTTIGAILLGFATALIFWAQTTSRDLEENNLTRESFCRGPYRVSRMPTHWGLFFLLLSFGIISNNVYGIVLSFCAFLLTKLVFIKKEEDVLAQKYGSPYLEYKKSIKL